MHLTLNSGQMDHSTSDFLTFLGPILELDPNPYPHKKKRYEREVLRICSEVLKVSPNVRDILEI
jgi:hypothetical protein